MADEITIQAALNVQRSTMSLQGAGTQPITPTGTRASGNHMTSATGSWTAVTLIGSGINAGYLFVKNLDGTNYLELALDNAGAQIFAKVRKNEFCLVPLKDSTSQIWARANTASVSAIIVAAEA
jgi:hypothetical protein